MPGFAGTMHEFGAGTLHSGSKHGPIVTNPKQAVAIAYKVSGKDGENGAEHRGGHKMPASLASLHAGPRARRFE